MLQYDPLSRRSPDLLGSRSIYTEFVEEYSELCYNQLRILEFVGVNDENFIYDWWDYGSRKNNCVPTAQTGFTE